MPALQALALAFGGGFAALAIVVSVVWSYMGAVARRFRKVGACPFCASLKRSQQTKAQGFDEGFDLGLSTAGEASDARRYSVRHMPAYTAAGVARMSPAELDMGLEHHEMLAQTLRAERERRAPPPTTEPSNDG